MTGKNIEQQTMNEENEYKKLRQLCNFYYQRQIGFDTYRSQRKLILDKIEDELNRTTDAGNSPVITHRKSKFEQQENDEVSLFPRNRGDSE